MTFCIIFILSLIQINKTNLLLVKQNWIGLPPQIIHLLNKMFSNIRFLSIKSKMTTTNAPFKLEEFLIHVVCFQWHTTKVWLCELSLRYILKNILLKSWIFLWIYFKRRFKKCFYFWLNCYDMWNRKILILKSPQLCPKIYIGAIVTSFNHNIYSKYKKFPTKMLHRKL